MQINSVVKTVDKSVTAELTILANVTDNQARYRCEAHNSATEIPLFETITLSVHCKYGTKKKQFCHLSVFAEFLFKINLIDCRSESVQTSNEI